MFSQSLDDDKLRCFLDDLCDLDFAVKHLSHHLNILPSHGIRGKMRQVLLFFLLGDSLCGSMWMNTSSVPRIRLLN